MANRRREMVRFAQWCIDQRLHPREVMEVLRLVDRHVNLETRYSNERDFPLSKVDRSREKVEAAVKVLWPDAVIAWPGMYPMIIKRPGGYEERLPLC